MDKLKIIGPCKLSGQINISGAKNAALPLIAATILNPNKITLNNVPDIQDINTMLELLNSLGIKTTKNKNTVDVDSSLMASCIADYDIVRKMRASFFILGPMLTRFGEAMVSLPGGCAIGPRPVDLHIDALKKMNVNICVENGYVIAKGKPCGANISFSKVSVGATENIIMAAVLAQGQTVINNAALEPEIGNLIDLLNAMGADIIGKNTNQIIINGVKEKDLKSVSFSVMPDRIETATYAVAAAITKSKLILNNTSSSFIVSPIMKLIDMGVDVQDINENQIMIDARDAVIVGCDIMTEPYPGFPTDLQAQMSALLAIANGASLVTESIFENRFMHVPELDRMGANINIHGNSSAIIRGVHHLTGAQVMATDLRASVSLVLAALAAYGETIISRIYHLDRGYEDIVGKLSDVGANIQRIKEGDNVL